ncbi:aldo-keto reductase AKR2E4-like [Bradysia coprophila]|uniref:aldo-keto reductase AKR2E4-like n=1 Tax=Bradysia coprophila TaxID=38358 RepID=UPI00187D75D0|nr:aldo-keto reductase AKR2E4-like [Bradysia coprophila]XP_037032804.1 aldo-keto reductase AKR2E4-like [Bradysia coprophila]
MTSIKIPDIVLSSGQKMPILGLGTVMFGEDKNKTYQAVREAINAGYRLIDTAAMYQTEPEIGRAIKDSIVDGEITRDQLFIVTKVWTDSLKRDKVLESAKASCERLGLDYVDLLLVHTPMPTIPGKSFEPDNDVDIYNETWKGMEDAQKAGFTKSIGVSNYNAKQIDETIKVAEIKPVVNEVESHPLLNQSKLQAHCESRGIKLIAYSPLGGTPRKSDMSTTVTDQNVRNQLVNNDLVKKLAEKYGKSPAQILIKYHPARGLIVIPKSVTKERIEQNANIFDFDLTEQEIEQLNALHNGTRYLHFKTSSIVNHKNFPFHDEY